MSLVTKEYSDGTGCIVYKSATPSQGDRPFQDTWRRLDPARCPPLSGHSVKDIRWKDDNSLTVECEYQPLPLDASRVIQARQTQSLNVFSIPVPTYSAPCKSGDRLLPSGECASLSPEACPPGDLVNVSLTSSGATCNYRMAPTQTEEKFLMSDEWMFLIAVALLFAMALIVL